jgi:outer membrane protein assembly factor BamD (BamD/ComL family)
VRLTLCVSLVALTLLVGCNRRPQPVVTTPPSTPPEVLVLQSAKREFAAANYANASRDYERYLELVPTGGDGDQALFHLGVIYSLPEAKLLDLPKASGLLNRLITEFPQSSFKPAAQLIVSAREQSAQLTREVARLTEESTQLRADAAQLRAEATQLRADNSQLRNSSTQLNDQLARLKVEAADQLQLEVDKRERTIRQLNTELERLYRIDAERRPRP